jgi:hypothetical protein
MTKPHPITILVLVCAALFITLMAVRLSAQATVQSPQTIGVLVSDPTGQVGVHVLPKQQIIFLMPALPDGVQVCTDFKGQGYTNCRSMKELRVPK